MMNKTCNFVGLIFCNNPKANGKNDYWVFVKDKANFQNGLQNDVNTAAN